MALNYGVPSSVTLPLLSSATTTYTNIGGTGNVLFNLSLSAVVNASLLSTYLSGNLSAAVFTLSGTLAPTSTSGLSASNAGIVLRWPSILGNQDVYGFVINTTNSAFTSTAPTSSFLATIDFNEPNFNNTLISLSGNGTAIKVLVATVDNPLYSTGFVSSTVYAGLSTVNLDFRTIANHCRILNQVG